MNNMNRNVVLHAMVKHETLTIHDILKEENLGMKPDVRQVESLISDLQGDGAIEPLHDVVPQTFTITVKGIAEYAQLPEAEKQKLPASRSRQQ